MDVIITLSYIWQTFVWVFYTGNFVFLDICVMPLNNSKRFDYMTAVYDRSKCVLSKRDISV